MAYGTGGRGKTPLKPSTNKTPKRGPKKGTGRRPAAPLKKGTGRR